MAYKDPERQRAYARQWLKRNPQKARDAVRRWNRSHPEQRRAAKRLYYARHREQHKAVMMAYHRAHPEVLQAKSSAYRGEVGPLQVDHRVPLSRGGTNSIDNILPACRSCNGRKHAMTEAEFRALLAAEGTAITPPTIE